MSFNLNNPELTPGDRGFEDDDYMKGMTEDEYADWQKSMRQSVSDPKFCTCDSVIPAAQRDVESDLHESHCPLYRP
jgi:hypothetical protein